jgi:hypothetical protein
LALNVVKHLHTFLGYVLFLLSMYEVKLGIDLFPLSSSDTIPQSYFWGMIAFWMTLYLLLELFKKRKLHRTIRKLIQQRERSGSFSSDSSGSSDGKEGPEEVKLLDEFELHWRKLIKSMGRSYVSQKISPFKVFGFTHELITL